MIDPLDFRRACGRFATGVTLVTAPGGDALVVNAFMSVSLDPPLIAFSPGRASLTWRRMRHAERLGVNVLPASVADVAQRARPRADRLAGLRVAAGGGVPRICDALAFLECEPLDERPAGDHTIVVAAVHALVTAEKPDPLVFFGGEYGTFAAA